jgi:hypothetical protein
VSVKSREGFRCSELTIKRVVLVIPLCWLFSWEDPLHCEVKMIIRRSSFIFPQLNKLSERLLFFPKSSSKILVLNSFSLPWSCVIMNTSLFSEKCNMKWSQDAVSSVTYRSNNCIPSHTSESYFPSHGGPGAQWSLNSREFLSNVESISNIWSYL